MVDDCIHSEERMSLVFRTLPLSNLGCVSVCLALSFVVRPNGELRLLKETFRDKVMLEMWQHWSPNLEIFGNKCFIEEK